MVVFQHRYCQGTKEHIEVTYIFVPKLFSYAADLKLLIPILLSVGALCLERACCWSVGTFPCNSTCVVVWLYRTPVCHAWGIFALYVLFAVSKRTT